MALRGVILRSTIFVLWFFVSAMTEEVSPQPEVALVASTPFRMKLAVPSNNAEDSTYYLDFAAIRHLEEATATTLLTQQQPLSNTNDDLFFVDAEVVVQQTDVSPTSTTVRFFVLGTTLVNTTAAVKDESRQEELNRLVDTTLNSSAGQQQLLSLLSSLPSLEDATLVTVTSILQPNNKNTDSPAATTTNTNGSRKKKLTVLDIVLITISGLILLGILYMVVEHHKDRGYIENQRFGALNQQHNAAVVTASDSAVEVMVNGTPNKYKTLLQQQQQQQTPSPPPRTAPIPPLRKQYHHHSPTVQKHSSQKQNDTPPNTPSTTGGSPPRSPVHVIRMTTLDDPEAMSLGSCSTGSCVRDDTNKWDPRRMQPRHVRQNQPVDGSTASSSSMAMASTKETADEDEGLLLDGDESSGGANVFEDTSTSTDERSLSRLGLDNDDDDVFRVDVANSDNKSMASAASAVTEWMKTIRVVPNSVANDSASRVVAIENKLSGITAESVNRVSSCQDDAMSHEKTEYLPSHESASTSSDDDSSNGSTSSIENTTIDGSSIGQISLERSLASSKAEQRPIEKMEV